MSTARMTAVVAGRVQGVGFRDWVRRTAEPRGLTGTATNLADGRVEVVAEGERADLEALLGQLRDGAGPGGVDSVEETWSDPRGDGTGFVTR